MTNGQRLKKILGLENFLEVWITRAIVQSSKPILCIFYDSKRPTTPLPKRRLFNLPYQAMIYTGSDLNNNKFKTPVFTPPLKIEMWGGNIQTGLFMTIDLAYTKLLQTRNFDKLPESFKKQVIGFYSIKENKLTDASFNEKVTIKDLLNKDAVDPHVDQFAVERKSIQGGENKAAKLLECNFDRANDHVTFIWLTEATEKYPPGYEYKEVPDKNNYNTKSDSILVANTSKTYELHLRLLDIIKNIKELDIENEITKENMKALIELSYVQVFSNDPSYLYTGIMYNDTMLDAAIKPCTIKPKVWDKLRGNSFLSKHLRNLISPGSIEFFLNIMASMLTGKLQKRGLL